MILNLLAKLSNRPNKNLFRSAKFKRIADYFGKIWPCTSGGKPVEKAQPRTRQIFLTSRAVILPIKYDGSIQGEYDAFSYLVGNTGFLANSILFPGKGVGRGRTLGFVDNDEPSLVEMASSKS